MCLSCILNLLIFLGKQHSKLKGVTQVLTLNKLMLREDINMKASESIRDKINTKNVLTVFNLAILYKLSNICKITFSYINSCFTAYVETKSLIELSYASVAKILGSSKLIIDSEMEVFNAANAWVSYNFTERSKFANQLLLKCRLPLLSNPVLKHLLSTSSSLTTIKECVSTIKKVIYEKENSAQTKSSSYYTNRYCNEHTFNILVCGGVAWDSGVVERVNVHRIDGSDLKNARPFPSMTVGRCRSSGAMCLKGDLYVFGGQNYYCDPVRYVERYSPSTYSWKIVARMCDDRVYFCSCAFMNRAYVFGGRYGEVYDATVTSSCFRFDAKYRKWKRIAEMIQPRESAACAVFQGNIVVSGGTNHTMYDWLNTVESYDAVLDRWSSMPNMILAHSHHSMVVASNKLFVIGDTFSEVFDNTSKKFVAVESPRFNRSYTAISIGHKIIILRNAATHLVCYDVDKDKWTAESCEVTRNLEDFFLARLPCYKKFCRKTFLQKL